MGSIAILSLTDFGSMEYELERARLMLLKAERNLEPDLLEALLEAAHFMVTMARIYVRVDTGSLQKSIRIERRKKLSVAVRAGGYVINPKTGRMVNYAGIVEVRYPYLKPAFEHIKPFLEREIDKVMTQLLSETHE